MRIIGLILIALLSLTSVSGTAHAAQVKMVVNGKTVTDYDINQRALFMRLERRGKSNADRRKLAEKELIDEAVMLSEARRLGFEANEKAVDEAYTRIAINAKLSANKLTQILNAAGVQTKTLKDRLRAQYAWQAVVANVLRQKVQISDLDLDLAAKEKLGETTSYDYMLTEIVFLNSAGGSVKSRTAQANQYRKNFNGCDSAVDLSLSYRDAAVRKLGRRHSTQLPDPVAAELAKLSVGGISKPRTVANGVQMLAVCQKSAAEDLTFVKNKLRNEVGSEKLESESEAYLDKLRKEASIERR
ncbi:peptidylprolyl isomerase [Maritalea porphyrae]|jgi:peptidyl-prolyl cis-trans isomerase SurA|uniref:peptidylprolyl isomerase n=1 Tax=Maritalea porphyrae TaxID=880732 RepID=UPI0022B07693|nr:peptidylprolyl isomerase [Maritalea porphyrae]MCZ4270959.1 peptidylprolyl isomerase [Maritalea porphyrae]